MARAEPKLIAHIVFRFDYGGLENGLVNVINGLSDPTMQHVVIALTEATEFADRLRGDVAVHSIGKRPGKDLGAYLRLYRLLRRLRPNVVHTRNLGTLDCQLVALLARVSVRIHGEHGWDVYDPDGTNRRYWFVRRLVFPFVHKVVTVSAHLRNWLVDIVGISPKKIEHICNGVDTKKFQPGGQAERDGVVIGSVTRFSEIKDPLNVVEAFIAVRNSGVNARLVMIGDGALRQAAVSRLEQAGLAGQAWLPGSRDDIAEQLRSMDVFVLGSLREGISNTILEAMASGLPLVASDTGGNPELIEVDVNGTLVPPGDWRSLANAICGYCQDEDMRTRHGLASRDRVLSLFSIDAMVGKYRRLYENALGLS